MDLAEWQISIKIRSKNDAISVCHLLAGSACSEDPCNKSHWGLLQIKELSIHVRRSAGRNILLIECLALLDAVGEQRGFATAFLTLCETGQLEMVQCLQELIIMAENSYHDALQYSSKGWGTFLVQQENMTMCFLGVIYVYQVKLGSGKKMHIKVHLAHNKMHEWT